MAGRLLHSASPTTSALLTDSTSATCVPASPLAGTLSLCSSSSRVGSCGCCRSPCNARLSRPSVSPLSFATAAHDVSLPISATSSVESLPSRPCVLRHKGVPSSLRWSQHHQAAPGLRYLRRSSHGLLGAGVRAWGPDRISPPSAPSVSAVNTREDGVVADGEDGALGDGSSHGQGGTVNQVKGPEGEEVVLGEGVNEDLDLGLDGNRGGDYIVGDYIGDGELERLVRDIATIERQNDTMVRQVSEYTRMLAEASRKLSMCAQSTRIEAAKLKKVARLQQAAEVRRLGEMRLAAAAEARRQEEERRRESMRAAAEWQAERLAAQQRAAEAAASLSTSAAPAEAEAGRNGALVQGMESVGTAQGRADLEGVGAAAQAAPEAAAAAAAATQLTSTPTNAAAVAEPEIAESPSTKVPTPSAPPGVVVAAAAAAAAAASAAANEYAAAGATRGPQTEESEAEDDRGSEWSTEAVQASSEGEEEEDTAVVTETTQCSIDHPGALSCLTTTIRKDDRNRQAVVTLEATVQCAGDACLTSAPSLGADDYAALAIATIADAATQMRREQRLQPGGEAGDPAASERRRRIEELLAKGHVVKARPVEPPSRFGHESFLVRLRSPDTKEEIDAMFKPRVEGDAEGWHRAPIEWVAYELNLLLGMDYIPPVAYRTGGVELTLSRSSDHSNSQHHHHEQHQQQQEQHTVRYEEGAFIYWVPHTKELRKVAAASWGVSVAHLLSDTRILDVLLNNSDRHHGHFLFGQHWTDGTMRPVLIDHAAGFRREAVVLMEHENAFQTGSIRCVSAHTYLRLRFLDRSILALKFSGMLSEQEITDLITRRDQVLKYLDHLVKERGYQRTYSETQQQPTIENDDTLKCISHLPPCFRPLFSFRYFNAVQSEAFGEVYTTDNNIVVSAPTGSGKTVLFELAILRLLSKTLTSGQDWESTFGKHLHLKCSEVTGDTDTTVKDLHNADIILTTPEKFDSLTRKHRDRGGLTLFGDIALLLIDEVHLLSDPRGAALEAIVSRLKMLSRYPEMSNSPISSIRFVAVSATIPNLHDIADWLLSKGKGTRRSNHLVDNRISLFFCVTGYAPAKNDFLFEKRLQYFLPEVIKQHNDGKPALVFCSTRKGAQDAAQHLATEFSKNGPYNNPLVTNQQQCDRLQAASLSTQDKVLQSCIRHGVAFHNGGLDQKNRTLVESLFLRGDLQIICTTATLAVGVNLPAHLVVIKSTQIYNKEKGGYVEYDRASILQMSGRAGRPQFDKTGKVVIMTRRETVYLYENLMSGAQPVESELLNSIIEHLNAEIVLLTVSDMSLAIDWLKNSFLYVRIQKNPLHYGIPSNLSEDQLKRKLKDICVQSINELVKYGMVTTDEYNYVLQPAEPGKLMAQSYLSFETMKAISQTPSGAKMEDVLGVLCRSKELSWIKLRRSEKKFLNDINSESSSRIRYHVMTPGGKVKRRIQDDNEKIFILINDTLSGDPSNLDFTMSQDVKGICTNGNRIATCMGRYFIFSKRYMESLSALCLAKCLRHHLWDTSQFLLKQLAGVGHVTAKALLAAGIDSFEKLRQSDPRRLESLTGRKYPFGNQIKEALESLPPSVDVTIAEGEKGNYSGKHEFRISLKRACFPKTTGKKNFVYLLVGNEQSNSLVFHEKICLETFASPYNITVSTSFTGPSATLVASVVHEDFVGIDIHTRFEIGPPVQDGNVHRTSAAEAAHAPESKEKLQVRTTAAEADGKSGELQQARISEERDDQDFEPPSFSLLGEEDIRPPTGGHFEQTSDSGSGTLEESKEWSNNIWSSTTEEGEKQQVVGGNKPKRKLSKFSENEDEMFKSVSRKVQKLSAASKGPLTAPHCASSLGACTPVPRGWPASRPAPFPRGSMSSLLSARSAGSRSTLTSGGSRGSLTSGNQESRREPAFSSQPGSAGSWASEANHEGDGPQGGPIQRRVLFSGLCASKEKETVSSPIMHGRNSNNPEGTLDLPTGIFGLRLKSFSSNSINVPAATSSRSPLKESQMGNSMSSLFDDFLDRPPMAVPAEAACIAGRTRQAESQTILSKSDSKPFVREFVKRPLTSHNEVLREINHPERSSDCSVVSVQNQQESLDDACNGSLFSFL
ncbi:unnamed protein product [Closterium sp. Yama58-4]|nr:unnamed protein product [Closterium sp. Yama58-4]